MIDCKAGEAITSLQKKLAHVNHYSFHIMDPDWGHSRSGPGPAHGGFSVADLAARVQAMTGQESCTIRQAACDLRELRGKNLASSPAPPAATTYPPTLPAPSRSCSPCETTASHRSWLASAVLDQAADPLTGPQSTATTPPSVLTCWLSSVTSASARSPTLIDNIL